MSQPHLVALFGEASNALLRVEPFADHFAHRVFAAFATLPAANVGPLANLRGRFPRLAQLVQQCRPRPLPDVAPALRLLRAAGNLHYVHLSNIPTGWPWEAEKRWRARCCTFARRLDAHSPNNSTLNVATWARFDWHGPGPVALDHRTYRAPPGAKAMTLSGDGASASRRARLETQFSYPLGAGRTFRISHGEDYARFFRAMGEPGVSFVLEERGRVLGTLGAAVRKLMSPDGGEENVIYLGDLKVAPEARTGMTFLRLAWEAERWSRAWSSRGFGVVMDGTPITPDAYTGRVGIPGARALGSVMVWRIPCLLERADSARPDFRRTRDDVLACYRQLSRGRYASLGGKPELRSQMVPEWLCHPGSRACGLVEDTRLAKRLWVDNGSEMRSGHPSYFAFSSTEDAVELLNEAVRIGPAGHPALLSPSPLATRGLARAGDGLTPCAAGHGVWRRAGRRGGLEHQRRRSDHAIPRASHHRAQADATLGASVF